jgi:hypothetical protein
MRKWLGENQLWRGSKPIMDSSRCHSALDISVRQDEAYLKAIEAELERRKTRTK